MKIKLIEILAVILIFGLLLTGPAIFLSNWNECREAGFSFIYCLYTIG